MSAHRLLRRMEAAGLIVWWKQYPEPIEVEIPPWLRAQRAMWRKITEALA